MGRYPIVGHGSEQIVEEWIDLLGIAGSQPRPIQRRKSVRQFLRLCEVFDPDKGVVELPVMNAPLIEFPSQPLMSVHIYLDLKGKPGLEPDMNQTEVSIHEIEIQE